MSAEELLAACDAALLRCKRAGKGRVELAAEGAPATPPAAGRAERRRALIDCGMAADSFDARGTL